MPEVLDMVLVSCDGRYALADFECWSAKLCKVVVVRAEYKLGDEQLDVVDRSEDAGIGEEVMVCRQCLADAREALLYQRDVNRDKN